MSDGELGLRPVLYHRGALLTLLAVIPQVEIGSDRQYK
jgi:hypothetical protein